MDTMNKINKKRACVYLILSLTVCIIYITFSGLNLISYRVINGLFIGGLFSLIPGLFFCVRNLGPLDVFFFSFGNLRAYSKHFEDELADKNRIKTYHEYREEKIKHPIQLEPLFIGAVSVILSIVISFIYI